jgi:ribosomal protein L35AE/L33A
LKKALTLTLVVLLTTALIPSPISANVTPLASLVMVEELLYGEAQAGALLDRIEKVEIDVYGALQDGAVLMRIDRVTSFLQSGDGGGGLQLLLNLAEWGFSAIVSGEQAMIERLEGLEVVLYGGVQPGDISKRAERLMLDIWGTTSLDVKRVNLPAQTLVKIALVSTIDSATAKVGDQVIYEVVEDVLVDGRVVIPSGVRGVATVTEVTSAGRLGKDGRVVVDFGRLTTLDGTRVKLQVDETATEKNKSLELAAGASMAGILLLGSPVGLVGGYFVRGKDVKIEANVPFFVETERATSVSGFYFRPASL